MCLWVCLRVRRVDGVVGGVGGGGQGGGGGCVRVIRHIGGCNLADGLGGWGRWEARACSECALGTLRLVGACTGVEGVRVGARGFQGVVEVGVVQM